MFGMYTKISMGVILLALSNIISGTTSTVCPSGCDFDNIQEAIDSIPSDLSSGGGGVWTVDIETAEYSEDITVSGFSNASASDYIVIKAKSGHEHLGNYFAGVRILGTTASVNALDISTNYTQISNLVVYSNNKSSNYDCVQVTGTNTILYQILAKVETYKNVKGFDVNVASAKISKCISWNSDNSTPWGGNQGFYLNANTEVYNSVAYRHGTGFWSGILKNCVAANSISNDFYVYQSGSEYNISSDETATDANDLTNQGLEDVNFDNIYLGDFRPVENSVLLGSGTNPSAGFSTDIIGETISSWMIGPFHSVDSNYKAHCDETGEYHVEHGIDTIQSVINSIPDTLIHCGPQVVYIEKGEYNENIEIDGLVWPNDTDYVEIRSEDGDEHLGIFGNGVKITGPDDDDATVFVGTQYTRISNIEASTEDKNTGINAQAYAFKTDAKYVLFQNALAYADFQSSPGFDLNESYTKCINCIAWNSENSTKYGTAIGFIASSTSEIYNSLVYSFNWGFSNGIVKNSVCYKGSGSTCFYSYQSGSDHNISSDATANDTANGDIPNTSLTQMDFVDEDNGEFKINSNSSVLYNTGLDLSSIFTQDIELQTIIKWPVGPFSRSKIMDDFAAILYWPMNEGEGDSLFDFLGTSNTGIFQQMDTTNNWENQWITGVEGTGIYFDGSGGGYADHIEGTLLPDSINNNFTFSIWANPENEITIKPECNEYSYYSPSQYTQIWGCTNGWPYRNGGNQEHAVFPKHGYSWGGGSSQSNAGAGISIGTNGVSVTEHAHYYLPTILVWDAGEDSLTGWNHYTIVYEEKTPSLYLNGVYVKTGLTSLEFKVHPSTELSIGHGLDYGPYNGELDAYWIFDGALSDQDVMDLYNSYTPPMAKRGIKKETEPNVNLFPGIFKSGNYLLVRNLSGEVNIYSVKGTKVLSIQVKNNSLINISELNQGIYLLKMPGYQMKFVK